MHFNLYIDDQTGSALNAIAQQSGESRNALIRHAIAAWITQQTQPQWPENILNFQGLNIPALENDRTDLLPPPEDPFA